MEHRETARVEPQAAVTRSVPKGRGRRLFMTLYVCRDSGGDGVYVFEGRREAPQCQAALASPDPGYLAGIVGWGGASAIEVELPETGQVTIYNDNAGGATQVLLRFRDYSNGGGGGHADLR